MKILMLTWEYPPRVVGGISRVVYDLSRTLIKDGHEVTVVTYKAYFWKHKRKWLYSIKWNNRRNIFKSNRNRKGRIKTKKRKTKTRKTRIRKI